MEGLNYVALDFETANEYRASACALGMLKVKNGNIKDTFYSLIDPETYFDPYNTYIHGITENDVAGAPTYLEIAKIMQHFIEDLPIVAHFAPFDTGVIRDSNQRYDVHFQFDYFDSYYLSRSLIQPKMISYKLDEVARFFGYQAFRHHHALEDCRACSFIIDGLAKKQNVSTVEDLIHIGGYNQFGHVNFDGTWNGFRKREYSKGTNFRELLASLDFDKASDADKNGDFFGKKVVFTGKLLSMERKKAMQCVVNGGGMPQPRITNETNILVIGRENLNVVGKDGKSAKIKKAEKLLSEGHDIQIIAEDDFIKMANG